MIKINSPTIILLFSITVLFNRPTLAAESEVETKGSMANCLKAWGKHPFGNNPAYKTLATSVKVFGIGQDPIDSEVTSSPALIMVNPGVNVMGGNDVCFS